MTTWTSGSICWWTWISASPLDWSSTIVLLHEWFWSLNDHSNSQEVKGRVAKFWVTASFLEVKVLSVEARLSRREPFKLSDQHLDQASDSASNAAQGLADHLPINYQTIWTFLAWSDLQALHYLINQWCRFWIRVKMVNNTNCADPFMLPRNIWGWMVISGSRSAGSSRHTHLNIDLRKQTNHFAVPSIMKELNFISYSDR